MNQKKKKAGDMTLWIRKFVLQEEEPLLESQNAHQKRSKTVQPLNPSTSRQRKENPDSSLAS